MGGTLVAIPRNPNDQVNDPVNISENIDNKNGKSEGKNISDPVNDPVNDPVKLLSDIECQVLNVLRNNPTANRAELSNVLKSSESTIKRAIARLKDLKLIERIGSDKKGYWKVKK